MKYLDMLAALGVSGAHPGGIESTKRLLAGRRLTAGARILEAGCGTGETACYLAQQGYRVTGMDRHPQMLAKARERAAKSGVSVEWVEGDLAAIPFAGGTFDVVLAESVTVFTPVRRTLREYRRVLKPGGLAIDTEIALARGMNRELRGRIAGYLGTPRLLSIRDWRQAFLGAGLLLERKIDMSPLFDGQVGSGAMQDADMSRLIDPAVLKSIVDYHELIVSNHEKFVACTFVARKSGIVARA